MSTSALLDARRLILIQYASRLPARSSNFLWPATDLLVLVQPSLTADLSSATWCEVAPTTYQKSFFKELIRRLERGVEQWNERLGEDEREEKALEVDAAILEHYAELMVVGGPSSHDPLSPAPPPPDNVTYLFPQLQSGLVLSPSDLGRNDEVGEGRGLLEGWCKVVLREEGASISQGSTGLKTWEASLQLSRYIVSNPSLVSHSRVLELGSGTGLLGLVSGMLQGEHADSAVSVPAAGQGGRGSTCLTDMEGMVLERLRETLSSNGISQPSHIRAEPLNWVELSSDLQDPSFCSVSGGATSLILNDVRPQVTLAADVVFDPSLCLALADVLHLAVTWHRRVEGWEGRPNDEPAAYVASTIRNPQTYETFLSHLRERGLVLQDVPLSAPALIQGKTCSLPLFPSAHDVTTGGMVRLLRISAQTGICN